MKIITALSNPKINEQLKQNTNYEILNNDIQYQEGVVEILEKEKEIDIIILSELLEGNLNIYQFILKIKEINKKVKIIIFLEKENKSLKEFLIKQNIKLIFYNHNTNLEQLINSIESEENEKQIVQEIKILKDIILKNNEKSKNIKKIFNKNKQKIKTCKLINVIGNHGVGKSIFCTNLAISCRDKNKKILLFDFDIYNQSIYTIFGTNKYSNKIRKKIKENEIYQNKIEIKELIIKINKNIHLLSGIDIYLKNKINSIKIKEYLEELKKDYDLIIVDNSSEYFCEYINYSLICADMTVLLLESNLLGINKSKIILEKIQQECNIENQKIKIIINKYNKNSIDKKIIENIFSNYEIIGKINQSNYYDLIINRNIKLNFIKRDIKKEYKKILEKIEKKYKKKESVLYEYQFIRKFRNR